jgi:hypothetical protein
MSMKLAIIIIGDDSATVIMIEYNARSYTVDWFGHSHVDCIGVEIALGSEDDGVFCSHSWEIIIIYELF